MGSTAGIEYRKAPVFFDKYIFQTVTCSDGNRFQVDRTLLLMQIISLYTAQQLDGQMAKPLGGQSNNWVKAVRVWMSSIASIAQFTLDWRPFYFFPFYSGSIVFPDFVVCRHKPIRPFKAPHFRRIIEPGGGTRHKSESSHTLPGRCHPTWALIKMTRQIKLGPPPKKKKHFLIWHIIISYDILVVVLAVRCLLFDYIPHISCRLLYSSAEKPPQKKKLMAAASAWEQTENKHKTHAHK